MKLHPLTSEQARFIWMRNGAVYTMMETTRYTLPVLYNGENFIDGSPGYAEKRTINQFSKRDDYPG
jgi:hypothetical protein